MMLSQPAVFTAEYSGKNLTTGSSTLLISLRSIAMPTSSEVTLFETERMSCLVVASNSCCPFVRAPGLVIAGKYCSNTSLPWRTIDHGMHVGIGGLRAAPRCRTAARRRGRRSPASRWASRRRGMPGFRRRDCAGRWQLLGLRGSSGRCEQEERAARPRRRNRLPPSRMPLSPFSSCYAGGGTEIFTDGRSSIF